MYSIGSTVKYVSKGETAKLEGTEGKVVTGTVVDILPDCLVVVPDHRAVPGAQFPYMKTEIDFSAIVH